MILISHDVPHVFEVADRIAFSAPAAELSWPHQRRAPTAVGITTGALPGIKTAPAHACSATYLRHRLELSAMS
jgi:hypothetical protein